MGGLEIYHIDLMSLRSNEETFEFHIDNDFFDAIGAQERGEAHATVSVMKVARDFRLDLHVEGYVSIPCDLCLDDMEQPIEGDRQLAVKLGNEYAEEDDLVTVDEQEGIVDTSWFIYEMIVLAIPIKHVHAPGKCNPAMMKTLEEYSVARSNSGEQTTDPRWSELEKLRTTIND